MTKPPVDGFDVNNEPWTFPELEEKLGGRVMVIVNPIGSRLGKSIVTDVARLAGNSPRVLEGELMPRFDRSGFWSYWQFVQKINANMVWFDEAVRYVDLKSFKDLLKPYKEEVLVDNRKTRRAKGRRQPNRKSWEKFNKGI